MTDPLFIVHAPSYDEDVGGVIVLHELCTRLNELGYPAKLWPPYKDIEVKGGPLATFRAIMDRIYGRVTYRKGPDANPIARRSDMRDGIMIYPETVSGNPAGAAQVVRWLLYYPGVHSGSVDFGPDDLLVPFSREFLSQGAVQSDELPLRVTRINPAYAPSDVPDADKRTADCVLVHKGRERTLDAHPAGAIPVDDLDHRARAEVFRRSRYLYSYDPYTYTNMMAALCGCVPIVVPVEGMSREQWYAEEQLRYGIAYGEADIEWARDTRDLLIAELARSREEENAGVRRFAQRCIEVFSNSR